MIKKNINLDNLSTTQIEEHHDSIRHKYGHNLLRITFSMRNIAPSMLQHVHHRRSFVLDTTSGKIVDNALETSQTTRKKSCCFPSRINPTHIENIPQYHTSIEPWKQQLRTDPRIKQQVLFWVIPKDLTFRSVPRKGRCGFSDL